MSSVQQRRDTVSPPLLVCALLFLDPRRWVGALIALFGILVSIVVPFFPKLLLERMFSEPAAAEIPPRVSMHRRPLSSPGQSIAAASSRATRTRRRPQTAGDCPLLPHVTFSFDRHPRFSAPSLIAGSSHSNSIPLDSSPSYLDSRLPSLPPSPSSLTPSLPLPPASPLPYIHPLSLPSLDSLDLAADDGSLTDKPLASSNTKRHFRVLMPKLGFGRRQSTTDLRSLNYGETSDVSVLSTTASDSTASPYSHLPSLDEWHGTRAFAVRRSSTNSGTSIPNPGLDRTPSYPTSRRRFSFFSREPSSPSLYKNKDLPVDSLPATPLSQPSFPSSTPISPVPELPSPRVLKSIVTSLPSNAVAGPSRSRVDSYPAPRVRLEDMTPLEQTTTPPLRPARTDPYKTYGVPVPGSDRARAFLKAEKDRIRFERERKERLRVISEQEIQREAQAGSAGSGSRHSEQQVSVEKAKRRERKFSPGIAKKCKELAPTHRSDPGHEADGEVEKVVMENGLEEFGVLPLPSLPAQTPARGTSSQVKRRWGFSRHSSEASGEKAEKRRGEKVKVKAKEKLVKDKSKSKSKDPDIVTSKVQPTSRDATRGSKKAFGFRSKDTPRNKDRGYSSDTNVPSLTYKLMYESSS